METMYETDRLRLSVLGKDAADRVLAYYLRNQDFLESWEPQRPEGFYTREYHEKLLENDLASFLMGNLMRLWISKKEDPERIIGTFAFANIVRGAFQSCHLGYKLDHEEMNRGYITEAIARGIRIVFDEMGLHRIEANIMPRNARSLRVVEKLGFYHEGLAHNYLKIQGKWEDHIHMVLLNDKV